MFDKLKHLLVKIFISFIGLYVYDNCLTNSDIPIDTLTFVLDNDKKVQFTLHKKVVVTDVYRFFRFTKYTKKYYLVRATFDDGLPEKILSYNNLKVSLTPGLLLLCDRRTIFKAMTSIYLDFIYRTSLIKCKSDKSC